MIACQYGYSIEQFGTMTRREVIECCYKIQKRMRDDYIFQAQLHGAKINAETSQQREDRKETTLTDEQRQKALRLVENEINKKD